MLGRGNSHREGPEEEQAWSFQRDGSHWGQRNGGERHGSNDRELGCLVRPDQAWPGKALKKPTRGAVLSRGLVWALRWRTNTKASHKMDREAMSERKIGNLLALKNPLGRIWSLRVDSESGYRPVWEDKELRTTPRFKVSRKRDMEKLGDSEGWGWGSLRVLMDVCNDRKLKTV